MPIKNWYVVSTKPNCEKKVADGLSRKGVDNFCPYNDVGSVSENRLRVRLEPLFPSLVFVHMNSLRLRELRNIDGFCNLMYWLDQPAIIRDIEVEMLKRFLKVHNRVWAERVSVNVGAIVTITNEMLGNEQNATSDDLKSVKLVLPSLGFSLTAEIEAEKAKSTEYVNGMKFNTASMENSLNFGL